MKKIKVFSFVLCLALVVAGCNNTQKGAAIGTGGGALWVPSLVRLQATLLLELP